jgi:hypothetical protein
VKPLGEGPFDCLVDHLDAGLLSVGDEVAIGLPLLVSLVFHYFVEYFEREFQQFVIQFFIIKVFGGDGEDGLDYLAADGVGVDEGDD